MLPQLLTAGVAKTVGLLFNETTFSGWIGLRDRIVGGVECWPTTTRTADARVIQTSRNQAEGYSPTVTWGVRTCIGWTQYQRGYRLKGPNGESGMRHPAQFPSTPDFTVQLSL